MRCWRSLMSRSKFLLKVGCGRVSNGSTSWVLKNDFWFSSRVLDCPIWLTMVSTSMSVMVLVILNFISPKSLLIHSVSWGKYAKIVVESFSSDCPPTISTLSTLFWESCVSNSNSRILSTSSPKKSIRTGISCAKLYTSTIPPRTANCPGS